MIEMDDLIELIEGELGPEEVEAMKLLFRHSIGDRRAFLNLSRLREAVEAADPIKNLRPSDKLKLDSLEYQVKLSEKIMAAITEQPQPEPPGKKRRNSAKPLQDPSRS